MFNLKNLLITALFFGLLINNSGCSKNNAYSNIPYAYVNFSINLELPSNYRLVTTGGSEYYTANSPSRGVVVYHYMPDEFMAYERTCPYNPENAKAIVEDYPGWSGLVIDKSCGSVYSLSDGSVVKGPAHLPLKQYHTSFDGVNIYIRN
jgi:Rieske Fe-S protein